MAKHGQQAAARTPAVTEPSVDRVADVDDAVVAMPALAARVVTIPPASPAPAAVGFVTALARLAQAASKGGDHQKHAVLHDLEVRAGSLMTHAVSAEAHLDGEAAELVRQLRRCL